MQIYNYLFFQIFWTLCCELLFLDGDVAAVLFMFFILLCFIIFFYFLFFSTTMIVIFNFNIFLGHLFIISFVCFNLNIWLKFSFYFLTNSVLRKSDLHPWMIFYFLQSGSIFAFITEYLLKQVFKFIRKIYTSYLFPVLFCLAFM